jgi:hypothetical protein
MEHALHFAFIAFSRHSEASRSVEFDVRDYMLQSFSFSEIVHRVERLRELFHRDY